MVAINNCTSTRGELPELMNCELPLLQVLPMSLLLLHAAAHLLGILVKQAAVELLADGVTGQHTVLVLEACQHTICAGGKSSE